MPDDLYDEDLEPGEFERMLAMLLMGYILADMISHPEGASRILEA
jgi:hypothetical protein